MKYFHKIGHFSSYFLIKTNTNKLRKQRKYYLISSAKSFILIIFTLVVSTEKKANTEINFIAETGTQNNQKGEKFQR